MKNTLNKVKVTLASIWVAITSFPLKALGVQLTRIPSSRQTYYGVMPPPEIIPSASPISTIINIVKISQILLGVIVFIIGVVNLIKIRKIEDKALKQKKIKRTGIIMLITIVVLFLLSLSVRLIKKYAA